MYPPPSDETSDGLLAAAWFLGAGAGLFLCSCVLLWFSCLRETREFWLYSGGYPVLLRDVVLIFYFPLLAFTFFSLLGLTLTICSKIGKSVGLGCLETVVISACWLLVCVSLVISFQNNVVNLWNGRPAHYKQPLLKQHGVEPLHNQGNSP